MARLNSLFYGWFSPSEIHLSRIAAHESGRAIRITSSSPKPDQPGSDAIFIGFVVPVGGQEIEKLKNMGAIYVQEFTP